MWRRGKGFTLIELMVVIAIILILALIAIPAYRNMQDRARKSRVQSDLRTLANALQMFYTDWNTYPPGQQPARLLPNSGPGAELTGNANASINVSTAISATGERGGIVYIEKLPVDPFDPNSGSYYYSANSDDSPATSYVLYSQTSAPNEYIYRDSLGNAGVTTSTPRPPS
jgi:type II secretion system protein G